MNELALTCTDLDTAIAWFSRLGLQLEMIAPADDPAVAVLVGSAARVRLERAGAVPRVDAAPTVVVSHGDGEWKCGRAGMAYRDLIPGRHGGRFIASHIRIGDGGPVPDYVHHHAIQLQLIYCYRGWVRVVYEGQGEPFVMEPGACVLQPPHIRHRVLDCSPGLEVIELSSPAAHATFADHVHALPDQTDDREHGGQLFARSVSAIEAATGGIARARVTSAGDLAHDGDLRFGFVLRGTATLVAPRQRHQLASTSAFAIPGGVAAHLEGGSADLEIFEVAVG